VLVVRLNVADASEAALNPTMTIFDADMGISSFFCGEDPVYIMWVSGPGIPSMVGQGRPHGTVLRRAEGYPVLSLRRLPLACTPSQRDSV